MQSETAKTLKNNAGKSRNFLKNGQDLRSQSEQKQKIKTDGLMVYNRHKLL
jgi:hypothetical protein